MMPRVSGDGVIGRHRNRPGSCCQEPDSAGARTFLSDIPVRPLAMGRAKRTRMSALQFVNSNIGWEFCDAKNSPIAIQWLDHATVDFELNWLAVFADSLD